jgi:hypothetical protein
MMRPTLEPSSHGVQHRWIPEICGRRGLAPSSCALVFGLLVAGCTGTIGQPHASGSGAAAGVAGGGAGGGGGAANPGIFKPGPASLRRLTAIQYWSVITDLLGPGAPQSSLDPDLNFDGSVSVGASLVSTSPTGVEQYETAAQQIGAWAVADPAGRTALIGCAAGVALDQACAQSFLTRFGELAFRRPLVDTEVARYMALYQVAGDFWTGIQAVITGLLQSPKFLYRVELGVPVASDPTTKQVRGTEMASRLSFLLWGTTPDGPLLDAALQMDQLGTPAAIAVQVTRMLASPKARIGMGAFFSEALNFQDMAVLNDPTLAADLHEETLQLVDDIVFTRNAPWQELFTSPSTFINGNLATYYGLPAPTSAGFVKVSWPATSGRVGFLGQGAFLVATSTPNHESPTLRGLSVRQDLLCQSIPPPPPGVNIQFPMPQQGNPMTTRQLLEQHRKDAVCATCHKFMDAIGVAFEHFDFQGKYRDEDNGLPIDASGDLDGAPFADARGLAGLVAARAELGACLVRKLYRAAVGHIEDADEEPAIVALDTRFVAAGNKVTSLVTDLVTSDAFRLVAAASP